MLIKCLRHKFSILSYSIMFNDFIKLYPEVSVFAYLSNQQVDLIDEGYDLAIRLGKLSDSSMMAKKLGKRKNTYHDWNCLLRKDHSSLLEKLKMCLEACVTINQYYRMKKSLLNY